MAAIRHAKEHADAAFRAPEAYLRLGVPWPDTDWADAWAAVANSAVAALRVVRHELGRAT